MEKITSSVSDGVTIRKAAGILTRRILSPRSRNTPRFQPARSSGTSPTPTPEIFLPRISKISPKPPSKRILIDRLTTKQPLSFHQNLKWTLDNRSANTSKHTNCPISSVSSPICTTPCSGCIPMTEFPESFQRTYKRECKTSYFICPPR